MLKDGQCQWRKPAWIIVEPMFPLFINQIKLAWVPKSLVNSKWLVTSEHVFVSWKLMIAYHALSLAGQSQLFDLGWLLLLHPPIFRYFRWFICIKTPRSHRPSTHGARSGHRFTWQVVAGFGCFLCILTLVAATKTVINDHQSTDIISWLYHEPIWTNH